MKEDIWRSSWKDWFLIPVIVIPGLVIIVYLLTRELSLPWYDVSFYNRGNILNSGTIGDAIGGITAPFINLLGAVLVYVAFKAQNRANKVQWAAIQREAIVEQSRQIESLLQEITKEVDSLEMSYTKYTWAIQIPGGKQAYSQDGPTKKGKSTLAIDYGTFLLSESKHWNTVHLDPKGVFVHYYTFNPDDFYNLYSKLRYIQISLKSIVTFLNSIDEEKQSLIYFRSKAFYSTRIGKSLALFGEALSKTSASFNVNSNDFISDQSYIDVFFGGSENNDTVIFNIIENQRKGFWKDIGY